MDVKEDSQFEIYEHFNGDIKVSGFLEQITLECLMFKLLVETIFYSSIQYYLSDSLYK